ncbi:MAG: hypothetical protein J7496_01870 [Novosphingobium sp.]|nr:hypothetical protein [Novosphingobium sp.]
MTVRVADGVIFLEGACPVEDAEPLLLALQDCAAAQVDVSGLERMHLAVAQLLLAAGPAIAGAPEPAFLRDLLLPAIAAFAREQTVSGRSDADL